MTEEKNPKRQIDWDLIEKDWRAGIKSKQQLEVEYGVSRQAITKHFAKRGITRNLKEKIRAKASSLVEEAAVPPQDPGIAPPAERDIVDANARLQSTVQLAHRTDIQRARKLAMSMLGELEVQTDRADLLDELTNFLLDPDDKPMQARIALLERVTSLGSRASTMKSLADSLKVLVGLERQAYGIDEDDGNDVDAGIEAVIKRVRAKNGAA